MTYGGLCGWLEKWLMLSSGKTVNMRDRLDPGGFIRRLDIVQGVNPINSLRYGAEIRCCLEP